MPAPLTLAFVRTAVVATRYGHIAKLLWAKLVTSNVVPIVASALAAIDCACGHRLLPNFRFIFSTTRLRNRKWAEGSTLGPLGRKP